ncbi:MAG: hypothetical protein PVS2B2_13580 [Candidatus Acidiferrum sp.]
MASLIGENDEIARRGDEGVLGGILKFAGIVVRKKRLGGQEGGAAIEAGHMLMAKYLKDNERVVGLRGYLLAGIILNLGADHEQRNAGQSGDDQDQ